MNKWLHKKDIIVIIAFLLVAFLSFFIWLFLFSDKGNKVLVEVDGKSVGTYSLNNDAIIPIENKKGEENNILVIKDNKAFMKEAKCRDGLCIKQGEICNVGQTIVCLPNKVVVSVVGDGEDDEYDSLTN